MPLIPSLHFTPDGVSGPRHVITINIALLTEGASPTPFVVEIIRRRFPTSAAATNLVKNNLAAPSVHALTAVLRSNLQQTIDAAKTIGHQYVVCAYLLPEERKSLDDYKRLVDLFNEAGGRLKEAGLQFCYHNHDFEFTPIDHKIPYDLLLAGTDPKTVKMEMDLYWITKAGQSPLKYFSTHPGRFPLVHVKDMDATPKRFFTEVGRGVINFKEIFADSDKAGIKHYFVEQDETPGSPLASIKMSIDYLKQLEF